MPLTIVGQGARDVGAELGYYNVKSTPYGAIGDGSANDTGAVQQAINAAVLAGGGRVYSPPGLYRITDTLQVPSISGLIFEGSGGSLGAFSANPGTRFYWDGPADRPMFQIQDNLRCAYRDFGIHASPSKPLLVGMQYENVSGGNAPSYNEFHSVVINGTNIGGLLQAGFYFKSVLDANSDFHQFIRCAVVNYGSAGAGSAGVLIMHSQSYSHQFFGCDMRPISGALNTVAASAGYDPYLNVSAAGGSGGSFKWYGGSMSYCSLADFYFGGHTDSIILEGMNSEKSTRLLETTGVTSAAMPIRVSDFRWADTGNLNADKYVIKCGHPGPVSIINGRIEVTAIDQTPRFYITGVATPAAGQRGGLRVCDTYIETDDTEIEAMFTANGDALIDVENVIVRRRRDSTFTRMNNIQPRRHNPIVVNTTPVTLSRLQFPGPILVDASGGARTVNLPALMHLGGIDVVIIKTDSSVNAVTIATNGTERINGAATISLPNQYDRAHLVAQGDGTINIYRMD